MKSRSRKKTLTVGVLLGAALLASAAIGISAAGAHSTPAKTGDRPATKAWSFGVMGDTQWTCADDPAGANPNSVPVSIINQVNAQFISMGVKFVIELGRPHRQRQRRGHRDARRCRPAAPQRRHRLLPGAWQP